jgi:hypothetical protein
MFPCRHRWGFPRRWPEFEGQTNVDVQTCAKCGGHRLSPVQFGREKPEQQAKEGKPRFFKWIHSNS